LFSKLGNPAAIVERELRVEIIPADYPSWDELDPEVLSSLWAMDKGSCRIRSMEEIRAEISPE